MSNVYLQAITAEGDESSEKEHTYKGRHTITEIKDLSFNFKTHNYARTAEFQIIPVKEFVPFVHTLPKTGLRNGTVGVWARGVLTDSTANPYFITWLDVEAPAEKHDDLAACIEAAQNLFLYLREHKLTEGLVVHLTGRGFRFSWPYAVQSEYAEAFVLWCKSLGCVDTSPSLKKAHYRVFAYRGNRRQGKPRDTHTALLDCSIFDLDQELYRIMVSGKPDVGAFYEWLPMIVPTMWLHDTWLRVLDEFKELLELKSLIHRARFPRPRGQVNWTAIFAELESRGIEYTQFSMAEKIYAKLRKCPICGRKDGNPFITHTGRVKCHHENSCPAATTKGGYAPWQWIEGYQQDHEISKTEPTDTIVTARQKITEAVRGNEKCCNQRFGWCREVNHHPTGPCSAAH